MDRARRFERSEEKLRRLSGAGLSTVAFWRACTPVLADAVPHYQSPCCYTADPASRLITSHFQEGIHAIPPEWLHMEYAEEAPNQLIDVARSPSGISTLHQATGGDPSATPRWQANMAYGADQEVIVALRSRTSDLWGAIGLYREPDRPRFDDAELAFLRALGPILAHGVRRSLLVGEATDPESPEAPGMIVLDADLDLSRPPRASIAGCSCWARTTAVRGGCHRPSSLSRRRSLARRPDEPPEVAVSRVLTRSGRWVILHGLPLDAGPDRQVAVIIEPADPARIAPLLMAAYELTDREQELTQQVLQGLSTTEIAAALVISVHTVQQHLKSVFDKTGVRSRRELVTKIFLRHYEPRLRDNEQRTIQHQPTRGGPFPERSR